MKKNTSTFSLFRKLLKGLWRYFILASIISLISVVFSFLLPQIVRIMIDSIIGNNPFDLPSFILSFIESLGGREYFLHRFYIVGLVIVVIAILQALFQSLQMRCATLFSEKLVYTLKKKIFSHILDLPHSWYVNAKTGDIIQRCSGDIEEIRDFLCNHFSNLLKVVSMTIVAFYFMFSLHVGLSFLMLAYLPLLVILSFYLGKKITKKYASSRDAEAKLVSDLQENLSGVRLVKAFAKEEYEHDRFTELNKNGTKIYIDLCSYRVKQFSIAAVLREFFNGMILLVSVLEVVYGRLTVGELLLFVSYNAMLAMPISMIGDSISKFSSAIVSARRIKEILDIEPEIDNHCGPEEIKGQIEFQNVSFSHGNKKVLSDVSFTINQGESIAILGPTGSGKSTVVQLISRLYDLADNEGKILIDGIDIRNIDRKVIHNQVGFVMQEQFLFAKSVGDNIRKGNKDIDIHRVEEAAKDASVHDDIIKLESGYETIVGERGVTLSGGQQQRVALARILAEQPKVLILDDSLNALDSLTESQILNTLKQKYKDTTIIIISHRMEVLQAVDRVLVLNEGRVEAFDNCKGLREKSTLYSRICERNEELLNILSRHVREKKQ